jgi:hypothetical protein
MRRAHAEHSENERHYTAWRCRQRVTIHSLGSRGHGRTSGACGTGHRSRTDSCSHIPWALERVYMDRPVHLSSPRAIHTPSPWGLGLRLHVCSARARSTRNGADTITAPLPEPPLVWAVICEARTKNRNQSARNCESVDHHGPPRSTLTTALPWSETRRGHPLHEATRGRTTGPRTGRPAASSAAQEKSPSCVPRTPGASPGRASSTALKHGNYSARWSCWGLADLPLRANRKPLALEACSESRCHADRLPSAPCRGRQGKHVKRAARAGGDCGRMQEGVGCRRNSISMR